MIDFGRDIAFHEPITDEDINDLVSHGEAIMDAEAVVDWSNDEEMDLMEFIQAKLSQKQQIVVMCVVHRYWDRLKAWDYGDIW